MYVCMYVCMVSTFSEYGSTGYGCQSCLWSAEHEKLTFPCLGSSLRILVSRDRFGRPVPIQALSTCPLHTNSGCGKDRRILIVPWRPAKAALVRNYLEAYWPCAGRLSAVNAIGTQSRDPISSGLTRWSMAVSLMDAAAELGRNPVSKHQIEPEYGDEQADAERDG